MNDIILPRVAVFSLEGRRVMKGVLTENELEELGRGEYYVLANHDLIKVPFVDPDLLNQIKAGMIRNGVYMAG